MPIRVMPDGSFICDSPDEAIAIRDRLLDRRVREARREARRVARPTVIAAGDPPNYGNASRATTTMVNTLTAAPSGVSSDELAQSLGVTARSLPPLMVALRRKFRAAGHNLEDLLVRERILDGQGRPISRYRLTAKGLEVAGEINAGDENVRKRAM